MHPLVYDNTDWLPINGTSVEETSTMYNSRFSSNHTSYEMLNTAMSNSFYTNANSDNIIDPTDQLVSRTIENELEIVNLDALMAFVGPNSVVEMTITTMASNIIVALGWIILGKRFAGLKKLAYVLMEIVLYSWSFL